MTVLSSHVTVPLNTRVKIVASDNMPQDVFLHEADHSESVTLYIGDSAVTASTGMHLHASQTIQLTLRPNDELYAFSSQGNPTVHVLQIQKND